MEEMKIQQKVFEMMEYAYVCLQQFPLHYADVVAGAVASALPQ